MTEYRRPSQLARHHDLGQFVCGSTEQTSWLLDHARLAHATGTAKVLVVTPADSDDVVAYYAWAMASVAGEDVPDRFRKGAGRYPQPVALLARLGVHQEHEGHGLGAGLLKDVILRTAELGTAIGCRGLLVHCESAEAEAFYRHVLPGFEASPTDPTHLLLLMKDLRGALSTGQT